MKSVLALALTSPSPWEPLVMPLRWQQTNALWTVKGRL